MNAWRTSWTSLIAGVALLVALVAVGGVSTAETAAADSRDDVEVRVWQHTLDPLRIYISARPQGSRSGDLRTFRLLLDDGVGRDGEYRYGDFAVSDIEVRIWQLISDPLRIEVSVREIGRGWPARPAELITLDREAGCCDYRFGDVTFTERHFPPPLTVTPGGAEVPRLAALTVSFPDPPATSDGELIVSIEPSVDGSFAWLDQRTLLFQPAYPGWDLGQTYRATVNAAAAGLDEDYAHTFTAEGKLEVSYVIPGDGDIEAPVNAQILVQFNRSVSTLTVLQEAPATLLLEISPPLEGQGEWLNTSLYRFIPTELRPNTRYNVHIPAGLTPDAHGELAADYTWSFSTVQPAVDSITPHNGATGVEPGEPIVVEFSLPMDQASVESGLILRSGEQSPISGSFEWNDDATTVSFTPDPPLELLTEYAIVVPAGLQGQGDGATRFERKVSFTTLAPPELLLTSPEDGHPYAGFSGIWLYYSNPMDLASFEGRISIVDDQGAPVEIESIRESGVWIYFAAKLATSTPYTVRIAEGVRNRVGRTASAYEFSFTTGVPGPPTPASIPTWLSLAAPGGFITFAADREQRLFYHAQGLSEVRFSLYRLDDSDAEILLARGSTAGWYPGDIRDDKYWFWSVAKPIRQWTREIGEEARKSARRYSTDLSGGGDPLPTGHFVLTAESATGQLDRKETFHLRLMVSIVDTAVITKLSHNDLLVWVLDHSTGEPLQAASVESRRISGDKLAEGANATTDSDGLARLSAGLKVSSAFPRYNDYVVHVSHGERFGVASTRWNLGSSRWQLGVGTHTYTPGPIGQVYTDRPVYRAGEVVYYRGIVRDDDDARYSIPDTSSEFALWVRSPNNETLFRTTVQPNELGTFSGQFTLPQDTPAGAYSLWLSLRGGRWSRYAVARFTVSQFRVPEFQVHINTADNDSLAGDMISVVTEASFFFGSPVADVDVSWSAHARPTTIQVPGYWGYSFVERRHYWWTADQWEVFRGSGSTRTDGEGLARFAVPANLKVGEGTARYTISSTVRDTSGQAISASTSVTVHPAYWYVGIRTDSYIGTVGKPQNVHLVTVDYQRQIAPNRPVTVRIISQRWDRNLYEWTELEVDTQTATTNETGEASIVFTPGTPGRYRLVAESTDDDGRVARSSRFIWISGEEYTPWPTRENDVIELIADRESYEVGDIAQVLVPAPYAGAIGLVTLERGGVLSTEVRRFETNSDVLSIPIEDWHIPNIYVGVVLYRPPTDDDPYPRYHVGYVELSVSTEPRRLNVSIEPERDRAMPGETVGYDVMVTDANGRGVSSEVSVAVVDQAVLSLLRGADIDAMSAFWFRRYLGVRTASSLSTSIDRRNEMFEDSADGDLADGGTDALIDCGRIHEARCPSEDYGSASESDAMADDGGDADIGLVDVATGEEDSPEPRTDFRNTALWIGHLQTNERGEASFELQLPDNVTTWLATAQAVTLVTQVGEGDSELLVTKPLLVRPALPRFVRVGDELSLRVLVTNRTQAGQEVVVSIRATAAIVLDEQDTKSAYIEAGGTALFAWSGNAVNDGSASVSFTAIGSSNDSDAVEITIPAHLNITAETVATGGVVEDASVIEALYLPEYLIPGTATLELRLQASLVGALDRELRSLAYRRLESSVRIASRIVGAVALKRSSPSGLSEVQLLELQNDVNRLVGEQRSDGGWAWCRRCVRTDIWVSGWVLFALGQARAEGVTVPGYAFNRAVRLINEYVNRETDIESPPEPNEHAFLLYALVSAANFGDDQDNHPNEAAQALGTAIRNIADQQRANLTAWGRAYLLLGLLATGHEADHEAVRTLLNDLTAANIASANGNHWQDPPVRGSMHNGSVRATALVLLALTEADPRHPLVEETVRWLVVGRSQNRWKSTVERAQGMAALGAFAQLTGETSGVYDYQALLNTQRLLDGSFDVPAGRLQDEVLISLDGLPLGEVSRVQLDREFGAEGRMYYTLNFRYATPASQIEALNRGFAVSRRYSLIDEPDQFVSSASIGDLVRVEITVVAPTDRLFVKVEDFLPAGLEPVDPQLDTVSTWTKERLQNDRNNALRFGAPSYYAPWFHWYYNPWDQVDTRDDRVILYADRLPEGVHQFIYYARVTTPGNFVVPPAHAEETYFPEVFGRGDSSRFTVRVAE